MSVIITPVLDYFDTDYYNAACTAWEITDPTGALLASHATRQSLYVLEEDALGACVCGRHPVAFFACRWCAQQLAENPPPEPTWAEPGEVDECPQCGTRGPTGTECCSPMFCVNPDCNNAIGGCCGPGDVPVLCAKCHYAAATTQKGKP